MMTILTHTPLYVWAILAFLIYRGAIALRQREQTVRAMCIMPLVMLGLSWQGIGNSFGFSAATELVWLGCLLAGCLPGWLLAKGSVLSVQPERSSLVLAGSVLPLLMMMAIFGLKYAVGVSLAMTPALRQAAPVALTVCAAYGLFNGLFLGSLLRKLAEYRRAQQQHGLLTAA